VSIFGAGGAAAGVIDGLLESISAMAHSNKRISTR
jgi:hypothetical protein